MLRRMNADEVKTVQIEILDYVHKFCLDNDINYWLDAGSLIGAVRHKGYIPWDDDIDLGMLRPDYDKFLALFNNNKDGYKVYSIDKDPNFLYPFVKVCKENTVLYEPDEKGTRLCLNIDILVYDNAPTSDEELEKMYDKRDFYRYLNYGQCKGMITGGFLKKLAKIMVKCIAMLFPKGYFCKKMIANSKKYKDVKTGRVGNFTGWTRFTCSDHVFNGYTDVEFEGKMYKAPVDYHYWLTEYYGDYMKLPPLEKQVTHHSYVAYIEE